MVRLRAIALLAWVLGVGALLPTATTIAFSYDEPVLDSRLSVVIEPSPGGGLEVRSEVEGHGYDDSIHFANTKALPASGFFAPQAIRNPVPQRLARVVDADFAGAPSLGGPGADRVFVTATDDIAGISTSRGLAERLTLLDDSFKPRSGPFAVIEFDAPMSGLGSPVFRSNPGFVGFGRTAGGAREFDLPNMLVDDLFNVSRRTVL